MTPGGSGPRAVLACLGGPGTTFGGGDLLPGPSFT